MAEREERAKVETAAGGSRWAFQVGTVLGIPIRIHATFVLILIWSGMSQIAFVLALFACVLLHELGHAATARRFGVRTREIVL
jgi:Zn-dependent protease